MTGATICVLSFKYVDGIYAWLCEDHADVRRAKGYLITAQKNPPHELPCDDCSTGEPTTIPTQGDAT